MTKIILLPALLFIMNVASFAQYNSSDTLNNGYNVNNICGVDEFGRTFTTITGTRADRYVGMFYWILLGQHPDIMNGIYDDTKILAADSGDPMANLFNKEGTEISPLNQCHYWGEPLYKYYNSADDYVIRKHIELLTAAGIDFLVFDVTNGYTYDNVWEKILRLLDEYKQEGWNVPGIAFYTNAYSESVMTHLYNVLYTKNLYPDVWFKPDGKRPLIIGKFDSVPASGMEQTIRDYFYFKSSQWPDERAHDGSTPDTMAFHPDGFPWIDWQKPQRLYKDVINVSPAQHPEIPFSDSYLRGAKNWGRGFVMAKGLNDTVPSTESFHYRYIPGKNDASKVRTGANFEQEWKLALKTDPQFIFVTGWNQWVATKQIYQAGTADERIVFVDGFNEEYSWDIEPMKGGFNDAFYLQLIQNVRKYKGISGNPIIPVEKTIDILGEPAQWDDIINTYKSIGSKNYGRNYAAFAKLKYSMAAPENNLQEIKVANDAENIYFYIKTENNITAYKESGSNWMNLFIGTGEVKKQGWEGYNYVINRTPGNDGKTNIELLDSTGRGIKVGDAEYTVNGNIMQIKISKASISLTGSKFQLYFKVADGIENTGDIMDYYVTGKSLPMGRISFVYNNVNLTSVMQDEKQVPREYSLSQNYPNPFNPVTEIKYTIAESGNVTLKVYNLLGEEIQTLVSSEQAAGSYTVNFDASKLASGLYMYRIQSGNFSLTKKMTLLK